MILWNSSWRRRIVVGATLVAAAAVGGTVVAVARTTSTGTVFTACLNRRTHVLSLVTISPATPKRCSGNTIRVTWNQRGRRGPRGPQGVPGVAHAYTAQQGLPADVKPSAGWVEIASMGVPAGAYAVSVSFSAEGYTETAWDCVLRPGGPGVSFDAVNDIVPVSLSGVVQVDGTTTTSISVACDMATYQPSDPQFDGSVFGTTFTALAVAAVN